jgi:hypothetical protein
VWRKRKQTREPAHEPSVFSAGIGDDCEAFLAGRLALFLRASGRPVPPVGWLNQVVHAGRSELFRLASENGTVTGSLAWRRAVGYLARSLLDRARETSRCVEDLQRELRLPLELELLGDPNAVRLDSADMIRLALTRLYELPELSA